MDYPNVPFLIDSTETRNDPVLLSVSRGGVPRARRLYARARRSFVIVHRALTDAQKQTIEQFLTDNRATAFVIYWPCRVGGVAYSVIEEAGQLEWHKNDGMWATQIRVIEA